MPETPLLNQIGQIGVTVHDVQKAITFYRDTLGMKFLFEVPGMAFFDCNGVRLMLSLPSAPEFDHPSPFIYFTIENIESVYSELRSRGVIFDRSPFLVAKMPQMEIWMAFFKDVDNNFLALMEEKKG